MQILLGGNFSGQQTEVISECSVCYVSPRSIIIHDTGFGILDILADFHIPSVSAPHCRNSSEIDFCHNAYQIACETKSISVSFILRDLNILIVPTGDAFILSLIAFDLCQTISLNDLHIGSQPVFYALV